MEEEEGKIISPIGQQSRMGLTECQQLSFPGAGRSVQRRLRAGQSQLLAPCHLVFGTVLLQVLLI